MPLRSMSVVMPLRAYIKSISSIRSI